MFHSKFVENIRQKPLQNNNDDDIPPRYIGIQNTDLEQRIQHTIRNLLELNDEELAYIEDMNCRNMFEIVKLLNNVINTLVANMMAIE